MVKKSSIAKDVIKKKYIDMNKQCNNCSKTFYIAEWDINFYKNWDVPNPDLCSDCRRQQRLAFRGANFYMRKCDLCNDIVMSFFSPKVQDFTIYCNDCWQSDKWDGFDYGRDFDGSRSFFEQFNDLYRQVPKHASNAIENENSQYIISAHRNKNCYVGDEFDFTEDSYYGYSYQDCKDICDSVYVGKCELGYELIKCKNCYRCVYVFNSYNCMDGYFLINCRGVKNSILCSNLRNVEYHVLNKPVPKEQFEKMRAEILSGSYKILQGYIDRYEELKKKSIYPYIIGANNTEVTGNYLTRCQDVSSAYFSNECVNAKYISEMQKSKDMMDVDFYQVELGYQSLHIGPESSNMIGDLYVWYSNAVWYSDEVHYSQDVFGCCGLKRQKYVILNKQYSKEDFFELRDRIVEHMKTSKEWGKFFPKNLSPHGYSQTFANRVYPLTQEDAEAAGWNWIIDDPLYQIEGVLEDLPDSIDDVSNDICSKIILCQDCNKSYKIVPQELEFYRRFKLPLPRYCFETRNKRRFLELGPQQLWHRECMCTQPDHNHKGRPADNAWRSHAGRCPIEFETTYSPERKEIVYCETCYQKEIY
ncbi:MAG: hypothetical protein Q8P90_06195 [bacterium]|nr:hypothetical protein [bacterium]